MWNNSCVICDEAERDLWFSDILSGLEERFGHLETASKDMASQVCSQNRRPGCWLTDLGFFQAKRLAMQQIAKSWFGL
jgi:hypothetical protein